MEAESINLESYDNYVHVILTTVKNFRRLMWKLLEDESAVEDCEQDVCLGLLEHFANNSEAWEQVDKKIPYIKSAIRHEIYDVLKKRSKAPISYDAEETSYLIDNHSDQGEFERKLNEDLDSKKFHLELMCLMNDSSPDEQKLLQLSFFEGLKPKQIAEMLGEDPEHISINCNSVRAKFRGQVKKILKSR